MAEKAAWFRLKRFRGTNCFSERKIIFVKLKFREFDYLRNSNYSMNVKTK